MIGDLISTLANAQKLSIQQIQRGVQSGSIPSYIGVPLIEQKTKQMQQAAAALQGQQAQGRPPIAEQVMQAADQVTRPAVPPSPTPPATGRQQPAPSMGIEAARSNMPEQYAGGGIVAFTEGGGTTTAAGLDEDDAYHRRVFGVTPKSQVPITDVDTASRILMGPSANAPQLNEPVVKRTFAPQAAPQAAPKETLQTPASVLPGIDNLEITRTPTTTPATPTLPNTEDLYDRYTQQARTDRDELRNLILGQKADRAAEEKQNLSTALMKAGFGMMAGRSPFAGVNVGEGAMAGVESYGKGIEQLRAGDRQMVQQLVGLGLKGQELDQAMRKMGIEQRHYDIVDPAIAAHYQSETSLAPAKQRLAEAQAGYTLAQTEAIPRELELKQSEIDARLKAITAKTAAGVMGRSSSIQKEISDLQKQGDSWATDPLNSPINRYLDPQTRLALKNSGTPSYDRAMLQVVYPLIDRVQNQRATQLREAAIKYGYSDSSNSNED